VLREQLEQQRADMEAFGDQLNQRGRELEDMRQELNKRGYVYLIAKSTITHSERTEKSWMA